jgi:serine/threonine-protein kinase
VPTTSPQLEQLTTAFAGRYRVERELGAGGMATVYLAADLKHDRKVAIKILKPELAAVLGAERFVVEIKTTASLHHPHILPLFDSGTVDGLPFYVMPYIEGETIRDKLNRETQFGVDDAVRVARQVADALDYAHRHGVIHRDIKPENILLHDGSPMVMDFGIALAVSAAAGGRMTETGLSLGTPHYMSPEQATAEKEITGRSDVYSLASVLYEMLAGQPPHVGGSAQQIIMKIIAEPVAPVTRFRKSVPPHVAAALEKALEKLPADRFENAKAFSEALGNPGFTTGNVASGVSAESRTRGGVYKALFGAAAALALVAIAGLAWSSLRSPAPAEAPVVRVSVDLQLGERLYPAAGGSSIAISPQGDRLVYVAQSGTGAHLMVRRTDELTARELTLSVVSGPVFSPDGRWIAYMDGPDIKKVPVDGGASLVLTSSLASRGVAWVGQDSIVVGSDLGMFIVASKGGTPRRIAEVDSTLLAMNPVVLPDGKTIVYVNGGGVATRRLAVVSLASHRATTLETAATAAIGMREGHLLYVTATGALDAVPFDVNAQRVTGDPVQLESDVRISGGGAPLASLSANGSLWFLSGQSMTRLVRVVEGKLDTPLFGQTRAFRTPRLSPDGRKIAVELNEVKGTSVWVYDVATGTFSFLTNDATYPEWSGDGRRVVFRSTDSRRPGIWWQLADGSAKAELLYQPPDQFNEALLSSDGKWLLYRTSPGLHNRDIYGVPLDGDRKPVLFVGGPSQESHMRLSPDGKWLVYESNETGPFEVYVRPFPNNGSRVQVSNDGGAEPLWSRSGNTIFYRTLFGGVESVSVRAAGTTFTVGERRLVLQPADYLTDITHTSYDVWPDGSGFLMVKPVGADARPMLVVNWGRTLREKLGVRR